MSDLSLFSAKLLVFILLSVTAASSAEAQASSLKSKLKNPTSSSSLKYSASLLVETLAPISKNEAGKRDFSGFYALTLGSTHQRTLISGSLKVPYIRQYSYEQEDGKDGDFSNPTYSLKKTIKSKGFINSYFYGVAGALPLGHESKHQTFNGSIGPSLGLSAVTGPFELKQSVAYRYSFFKYDIQDDGTINSPHNYSSTSALTLNVSKSLSTSASVVVFYSRSFQNTGVSSTWSTLSIDYAIKKNVSIGTGVSTLSGTLSPDGQRNSVTVFEPNTTQVFFDLSFST